MSELLGIARFRFHEGKREESPWCTANCSVSQVQS